MVNITYLLSDKLSTLEFFLENLEIIHFQLSEKSIFLEKKLQSDEIWKQSIFFENFSKLVKNPFLWEKQNRVLEICNYENNPFSLKKFPSWWKIHFFGKKTSGSWNMTKLPHWWIHVLVSNDHVGEFNSHVSTELWTLENIIFSLLNSRWIK